MLLKGRRFFERLCTMTETMKTMLLVNFVSPLLQTFYRRV